ncbi:MAG TPA: helical backbone metal receptor [Gemmatimonadaceae bacterium]|nr:helical backbone metal receptor [Gemmatimonadaceae bacterium]
MRFRTLRFFSSAAGASIVASLVIAGACTRTEPHTATTLDDDFGERVVLDRAPSRIVSLNPTTTEILFAIGAGDRLVARSRWDLWPDSARLLPDVGDGLRPSVEAILARRPDLVVLYAGADNRAAAERLRSAGVPTLGLKIDRIEHFARATRLLGLITGDSARAIAVADSVLAVIDDVRARTAGRERPTVFWYIWDSPLITIGTGSFMHQLIEIAGGRNAYEDFADASPPVSLEDVARRDPRFILAGPDGAATLRTRPSWRAVSAVREGRVLVVDTILVARPSVMLGDAARSLATLLHPEIVW